MTLFNFLAPAAATFYKHPYFSSADDIVPDLKGKVAIVTGASGGSSDSSNEEFIVSDTQGHFSKVVWAWRQLYS